MAMETISRQAYARPRHERRPQARDRISSKDAESEARRIYEQPYLIRVASSRTNRPA